MGCNADFVVSDIIVPPIYIATDTVTGEFQSMVAEKSTSYVPVTGITNPPTGAVVDMVQPPLCDTILVNVIIVPVVVDMLIAPLAPLRIAQA